jgi:hypothetical protein
MMLGNIPPKITGNCEAPAIKESDLNFQPQIDKLRQQQNYLWIAVVVLAVLLVLNMNKK